MNPSSQKTRAIRRRLRIVVPALLALAAAACATTPPVPTTSLQSAQQAIANAERVDAGSLAAAELDEAREKMTSANQAVDKEQMVFAGQLADEARAAAELASARAGAAKANAVNEEMKRSNATLIEEMQRKTGDSR